jgi:hydrogenase expression/formation protein HypC
MCLALPARVLAIDNSTDIATVAIGEVKKDVSLSLVEEVEVDDFVLIHVGYALNKIDQEEAEKTLQLFAEAGLMSELES